MSKSDRPNQRPGSDANPAPPADTVLPKVSGRSATVAEIGRELGVLDFEPEDLLASLRPFDPSDHAAVGLGRASTADRSMDLSALGAPKPPAWNERDGPASPGPDPFPTHAPLVEEFQPQEPPTHALTNVTPGPSASPVAWPDPAADSTPLPDPSPSPSRQAVPTLAPETHSTIPTDVPEAMPLSTDPAKQIPVSKRSITSRSVGSPSVSLSQRLSNVPRPPVLSRPPLAKDPKRVDAPSSGARLPGELPSQLAAPAQPAAPDSDAPDITSSDDAVVLEELTALPPERSESLAFELERPACDHLREHGLIDAYQDLAVVLTREAQAQRHPQEQAELALVTSELLAMLGELDTAREYLHALTPTYTPTVALQARQLAFSAQDLPAYAHLVKGEIRNSISHEARRHLMALYSDVLQLVSQDEAESRRHLELSLRAFPSDPRLWLQRISGQLGDRGSPSRLRPPNIPESPKLSEAIRDLSALRGAVVKPRDCAHPAGHLMAARRAWRKRDLIQLVDAIAELRSIDEFSPSASWLYACLTAQNPEHRKIGTSFLEALLEQGDQEAELALLERRLHASSDTPTSVETFSLGAVANLSPADRLSLGVAVGVDSDTLRLLSEGAANRTATVPLSRAVEWVYSLASASREDTDPNQIRFALGTTIGILPDLPISSGPGVEPTPSESIQQDSAPRDKPEPARALPESLAAALRLLEQSDPEDALCKVLRLLGCVMRGEPGELASTLTALGPDICDTEPAVLLVLGALLAQVAGATDLQTKSLKQAILHDGRIETAYRGLVAVDPSMDPSATLRQLLARLEPSARRAILELEARMVDATPTDALEGSLQDCLSTLPTLGPLVALLAATSPKPSSRCWSLLGFRAGTHKVRHFVALLEELSQAATTPSNGDVPRHPIDTRIAIDDPHAYALCAALKCDLLPIDIESPMLDAQLRDWLRATQMATQIPFDLDPIDPRQLTELAERHRSPILTHWANLHHAMRGGDRGAFEKQLALAAAADNTARFVDTAWEAGYLDPNLEPTLGSIDVARRILEKDPNHLGALRLTLRHAARHKDLHDTGQVAAKIARQLDRCERLSHAWLAIVSSTYTNDVDSNLDQTLQIDSLLQHHEPPPAWASRKLLSLARATGDDQHNLEHVNLLRESSTRAMDAATLTLRAAEAASRLEQWDMVGQLLERTVDLFPEHLVALSMRAEFLEARGDLPLAAAAYDALAHAACMPAHKVAAWVQAATLWGDQTSGKQASDRALLALEHAFELEPSHVEAAARLRNEYVARGELAKLEQLLTQLLLRVNDSTERAQLEFERARTLVDLDRIEEALNGLERCLSLTQDHEQALVLLARLHEERGDFAGAEQQLLQLASLGTDEARKVEAYQRLAILYDTHLDQPARAEVAYREVLQLRPNDPSADQLVRLLLRRDNPAGAIELLQQLISAAADPMVERARSLELARIFDEVSGDPRRAEEIFDRVRRRWPNDASALKALASFYRRGKDLVAFNALLDRSIIDARRALGSGRFDTTFFEVITSVAELRDQADFASVAHATLSALNARDSHIEGVGVRASEEPFADILAPEVLSLPLRALLRKTGWALCAAHPIDVRALRATPLAQSQPDLSEHVRAFARGFGLFEIDLHLSPALGAVCQPISSVPATLVVGPDFVSLSDESVRDALTIRALRILSANAAALANTAPVDLWPLLVAYLSVYLPEWLPAGVDAAKIAPIRERIQAVLPAHQADRDLPMLAADVAASVGNRASQLGIAVQQWGSRTALLALGDPGTILTAISAASGQLDRLSADPIERQRWIVRNPEARDLTVFSITDAYLEARAKALGRG